MLSMEIAAIIWLWIACRPSACYVRHCRVEPVAVLLLQVAGEIGLLLGSRELKTFNNISFSV